ncbi:MAG: cytochrome C [Burkholderiaceae bacterium]
MRAALIASLSLASAVHGASAVAADADMAAAAELAKTSGCLTCHSLTEKIVGPAYSSVAAKYAGDKDAVATLAQSIQMGSSGKWGRIAMPAQSSVSANDAKLLATWILSTKP